MNQVQTILFYTAAIVSFITTVGYIILYKKGYYSSTTWRTKKWEKWLRILKYISFILIILFLLSFVEDSNYY